MRILTLSLFPLFLLAQGPATQTAKRSIVVTLDDLPFVSDSPLAELQRGTATLLATLKAHRVPAIGFVSENKLFDPAYQSPDGYIGPHGPSWLARWAKGLGKKLTVYGQPDPPEWVNRLAAEK